MSVFGHGDGELEEDGDGAASRRCAPSGELLPLQAALDRKLAAS